MSAVEERVVIKVEVNTDVAKAHAQLETFFDMLEARSKRTNRNLNKTDKELKKIDKTTNKVAKTNGKLEKSNNKVTKSFVRLKKTLKTVGGVLSNFLSKFSLFSFIGVAVEIALISTALLSVKLALVSGRLAVQAYQMALTGLGVAAGGVAVVLGSVAAAMRQLNEATLAPDIGGYKQAAQAMRSVMSDSQLSFFGMEGLQSSVNALARGGVSTDRSYTKILKSLGNYTSDPKQLADLATVYADVTKSGSISGDSLGKLEDINPVLTAGITELTGLSGDDLEAVLGEDGAGIGSDVFEALLAGGADVTDAWEGQLARMNNTVIGTLKGMLPRMFTLFADLGVPFLDTIQQTLTSVERIIEKTVMRIRGSVTGFGLDSFMPGLLAGFEKLSDWIARLVNESLPKVEGFFDGMMSAWDTVRNYFIDMVRIFQPLEAGADVLLRILSPQFGGLFDGFAKLIKNFSKSLVENERTFQSFGDAISRFIEGFLGFFDNANDRFVEAIPVWVNLLDALTEDVLPALQDVFNMLHEASVTVLPVVTKALSVVAEVLSSVATSLTSLMSIPGIGQLLGLGIGGMMFKTTRAPMMAAGRATGLLSKPAMAGAAATTGLLARGLRGQVPIPGMYAHGGTMASAQRGAAATNGRIVGGGATAGVGAMLATGTAGAVAGYGVGRYVGNRNEGSGGRALGAVSGAGVAAVVGGILGTMVFPGLGTAAGAALGAGVATIAGGVAGYLGAKGAQDAKAAGQRLSAKVLEGISESFDMRLSQGQNREALDGATKNFNDFWAENLDKLTPYDKGRYFEKYAELTETVKEKTKILNINLTALSSATDKSTDDIENLANTLGVDLTDAIGNVLEKAEELQILSAYDYSVPGIQDTANSFLDDSLFGPGSVYSEEHIVPQRRDTLNALLNEGKDVVDRGGTLDADMIKNITQALWAFDQVAYAMEGSDLAEGFTHDFPELDSILGTDVFVPMMADIERFKASMLDPEQNPAMNALRLTTQDEATALSAPGTDVLTIIADSERRFAEKVEYLEGFRGADFDEKLNEMVEASKRAVELAQGAELTEAISTTILDFQSLSEVMQPAIDLLTFATSPDQPDINAGETGTAWNYATLGALGDSYGSSVPGQASTGFSGPSTSLTSSSTYQSSLASTVNMNVEGLGLKEAMALMRAEAERLVRNINQRQSGVYDVGGGRLAT